MKRTPSQIEQALASYFNGTNEWHRWSILFPYTLTDGAKFVADECGAYWLMDKIASLQHKHNVRAEGFQVWQLKCAEAGGGRATLLCGDGNDNFVYSEVIDYTDFPLKEVTLWFINGVILLPSEY